jgi:hypothetical protein
MKSVLVVGVALGLMTPALGGCVSAARNTPPRAWARVDGKKIRDNPALQAQAKADEAQCIAEAAMAASGVQAPSTIQQNVNVTIGNSSGGRFAGAGDAFEDAFQQASRQGAVTAQRRELAKAVGLGCMARRGYIQEG